MDSSVKALLAKCWKDEPLDLEVGTTFVDETFLVHVSGSVVRQNDAMVAPTTSLPLIPILALFWQRLGATREHAMEALRDSLVAALQDGTDKDEQIKSKIKDCEVAINAIKSELLERLPKVRRSGRVITKDLEVEILPVEDGVLAAA